METKKDLLNSIVYNIANEQKHELSILVLMTYLEYCSNGTDNLSYFLIPIGEKKLGKEDINWAKGDTNQTTVPKKDFLVMLVETREIVERRVIGHISTLIVDKEKNKYYLLDPSEDVHQEKIRNKMHIRGEVFEKSELDKDTIVLNKDGILLQNGWSCTYWAMCSAKVFLSKNSIKDIIVNNTLKFEVFREIITEIESINKGLLDDKNCGTFGDQLKYNQERQVCR